MFPVETRLNGTIEFKRPSNSFEFLLFLQRTLLFSQFYKLPPRVTVSE